MQWEECPDRRPQGTSRFALVKQRQLWTLLLSFHTRHTGHTLFHSSRVGRCPALHAPRGDPRRDVGGHHQCDRRLRIAGDLSRAAATRLPARDRQCLQQPRAGRRGVTASLWIPSGVAWAGADPGPYGADVDAQVDRRGGCCSSCPRRRSRPSSRCSSSSRLPDGRLRAANPGVVEGPPSRVPRAPAGSAWPCSRGSPSLRSTAATSGPPQGSFSPGLLSTLATGDRRNPQRDQNVLGTCVNIVAAIVFPHRRRDRIDWWVVLFITIGAVAGGVIGASIGRWLPAPVLRGRHPRRRCRRRRQARLVPVEGNMPIAITDLADPDLRDYVRDDRCRHCGGSNPSAIVHRRVREGHSARARRGYTVRSLLMERRWLADLGDVVARQAEARHPVYVGERETLERSRDSTSTGVPSPRCAGAPSTTSRAVVAGRDASSSSEHRRSHECRGDLPLGRGTGCRRGANDAAMRGSAVSAGDPGVDGDGLSGALDPDHAVAGRVGNVARRWLRHGGSGIVRRLGDPRRRGRGCAERLALVLGTEGDGLSTRTIAAVDRVVRIPMRGGSTRSTWRRPRRWLPGRSGRRLSRTSARLLPVRFRPPPRPESPPFHEPGRQGGDLVAFPSPHPPSARSSPPSSRRDSVSSAASSISPRAWSRPPWSGRSCRVAGRGAPRVDHGRFSSGRSSSWRWGRMGGIPRRRPPPHARDLCGVRRSPLPRRQSARRNARGDGGRPAARRGVGPDSGVRLSSTRGLILTIALTLGSSFSGCRSSRNPTESGATTRRAVLICTLLGLMTAVGAIGAALFPQDGEHDGDERRPRLQRGCPALSRRRGNCSSGARGEESVTLGAMFFLGFLVVYVWQPWAGEAGAGPGGPGWPQRHQCGEQQADAGEASGRKHRRPPNRRCEARAAGRPRGARVACSAEKPSCPRESGRRPRESMSLSWATPPRSSRGPSARGISGHVRGHRECRRRITARRGPPWPRPQDRSRRRGRRSSDRGCGPRRRRRRRPETRALTRTPREPARHR